MYDMTEQSERVAKQNKEAAVVNDQVPNIAGKFPDSVVPSAEYSDEPTAQLGQGNGLNAGLGGGAGAAFEFEQYPKDLSVSPGTDPKQNPTPTANPSAQSAVQVPQNQLTKEAQNKFQHTNQPAPSAAPTLTRT